MFEKKNFPHDNYLIGHIFDYAYERLSNETICKAIHDYHHAHSSNGNGKQLKELINKFGFIEFWNVTDVTSLKNAFDGLRDFNYAILRWNVRNVTNMVFAFGCTKNFSSDVGNWNVSNVRDMSYVFGGSENFNANLSRWDVSNVQNLSYAFCFTTCFNCVITCWNVKSVTNMKGIFSRA